MKLLRLILASFLFAAFDSHGEEQAIKTLTAFYLSGEGRGLECDESTFFLSDGDFNVAKGFCQRGVRFSFKALEREDSWDIEFGAPYKDQLQLGVYKNTRRCAFSDNAPGLDITHNHSFSSCSGEFEILELNYGVEGEVVAFAANFATEGASPFFGSIRFHSSVPVEKRFSPSSEPGDNPAVIYYSKEDSLLEEASQSVLLTGGSNTVQVQPLPFGGEGVRVFVRGADEKWIFDFAAPIGGVIEKKRYETSCRYPFHGYLEAGIGVSLSRSCAAMPAGWFEVIDVQRDSAGKISKLKFNFSIKTEDGAIYEGTVEHLVPNSNRKQTIFEKRRS